MITFKNPYLGNTCVPFQHWACSLNCAKDLEVPARLEQIRKAQELDAKYERYVQECQRSFMQCNKKRPVITCLSSSVENDLIASCNSSLVSMNSSAWSSYMSDESTVDMSAPVQSKKCVLM